MDGRFGGDAFALTWFGAVLGFAVRSAFGRESTVVANGVGFYCVSLWQRFVWVDFG